MTKFIREPLVHFVLLAGLVFAAYQVLNDGRSSSDSTIVVTQADMERLATLYAAESGTLPTERDMRAMVMDHVQQQALAREARALGMADGDTVVERRLAQKMTFMLSDLDQVGEPTERELEAWLADHIGRFTEPARYSFDHIFFSDAEDARIGVALAGLNEGDEADWRAVGDPFMLQRAYADLPDREIVRLFGGAFAEAIITLDANQEWRGPIESALGVHLVRVTRKTESRQPTLSDVKNSVVRDWREENQRRRTAEEIQSIVAKYNVVIEGAADQ